jgi:hypothetical protein
MSTEYHTGFQDVKYFLWILAILAGKNGRNGHKALGYDLVRNMVVKPLGTGITP